MSHDLPQIQTDVPTEIQRITHLLCDYLSDFKRDGYVIGLSGGIDSTLASALCVKAVGKERVFGLILPERDSNPISEKLAIEHAEKLGIEYKVEDITPVLDAFGTYQKRDEVISKLYPDYCSKHRVKLSLPTDLMKKDSLNFFTLELLEGDKTIFSTRLRNNDQRIIMASTDTKQRTRMMHLYYQAESRNYAVCGTTNHTELVQGYFVKYGDGGVDIEPLAHLYKAQVYDLSSTLNLHKGIIDRTPSPDTFNSYVSDEEFFLRIPYDILDRLLLKWENKITPEDTAKKLGLTLDQVKRAFRDFESKFKASRYLRMLPPTL